MDSEGPGSAVGGSFRTENSATAGGDAVASEGPGSTVDRSFATPTAGGAGAGPRCDDSAAGTDELGDDCVGPGSSHSGASSESTAGPGRKRGAGPGSGPRNSEQAAAIASTSVSPSVSEVRAPGLHLVTFDEELGDFMAPAQKGRKSSVTKLVSVVRGHYRCLAGVCDLTPRNQKRQQLKKKCSIVFDCRAQSILICAEQNGWKTRLCAEN